MTSQVKISAHCASDKEVVVALRFSDAPQVIETLQDGEVRELSVYDDREVVVFERLKCGSSPAADEELHLNQQVSLLMSGEQGRVIGIANYLDGGTQYQVRYVTRGGEQREQWIGMSGLVAYVTSEG